MAVVGFRKSDTPVLNTLTRIIKDFLTLINDFQFYIFSLNVTDLRPNDSTDLEKRH